MAIITLGGGNAQWSGDANGHGGVLLFDANNRPLLPVVSGAYAAPVEFRHTAADVAGSTIWDWRGPAALSAFLKSIAGIISFDGTAVAATTLRYGFYRGAGAASPTGGTTLTAVKKKSTYAASSLVALQGNGVLTTTGITYDANPFAVIAVPIPVTGQAIRFNFHWDNAMELDSAFVFAANEHLAIRLEVAAAIGLTLTGSLEWDER
jgi:hypothetical protein